MKSPRPVIRTFRIPSSFEPHIEADPAAKSNFSAFLRTIVDAFISAKLTVIPTRQLTRDLDVKVSEKVFGVSLPPAISKHYARIAKAMKLKSLSALFINAIGAHYGILPGLTQRTGFAPISGSLAA